MKIAILGTRGIPNSHGGFDRAAEEISTRLVKNGHQVTVYNTDDHPFKDDAWKGVKIKHIFSREQKIGIFGTFLFDYLCLKDAAESGFDVIFEMGHYPAAIFFPLFRHIDAVLATNIDGLCWMRPKWSKPIRQFILSCEKIAVHQSDALIADHPEIQSYCFSRYGKQAQFIAYGAVIPEGNNNRQLEKLALQASGYDMLVARLEPENNIEMILDGYLQSSSKLPFIVVGGLNTKHAKHLMARYKANSCIRFVGTIYDYEELSGLRQHCRIYFHGHSVGGTTPSLLEAMACQSYIAAHDNRFNRGVLGEDALYFTSAEDAARLFQQESPHRQAFIENNLAKVQQHYDWDDITTKHELFFQEQIIKKRSLISKISNRVEIRDVQH
jgi:glycosyltransferase involved in cell wall biosynthesis